MSEWQNIALIIAIIFFILFYVALQVYQKRNIKKFDKDDEANRTKYTFEALLEFAKNRLTELATENLYLLNLTEDEYNRRHRRRQELREALKKCNTGDLASKIYVREFLIELFVSEYGITEHNIDWIIPFDAPNEMTHEERFHTVLRLATNKYGFDALAYIIDTYQLDKEQPETGYEISELDIERVYKDTVRGRQIEFKDKLQVVAQYIYSRYQGFGVIDEIREMNIDGVSGGVSGMPMRDTATGEDYKILMRGTNVLGSNLNSVWLMYKGKNIHLTFLSFEHEAELRRVVSNIYKYNSPGQLSESNPYIINELADGSRTTVFRPKFTESWAFFIRKKYDPKLLQLETLIKGENAELVIEMLKYLSKGERTTAITGKQGSGKTTLLMAMIGYINNALTLRIQETSFELNLRKLYPRLKNILSFQETNTVKGREGLDAQKKTDGDVQIIGEIATDEVASWAVQSAQVGTRFLFFSHHGKTFNDLLYSMRNSLLNTGSFRSEKLAEEQVARVLDFNAHLRAEITGLRYVSRVTECIYLTDDDDTEVLRKDLEHASRDKKIDKLIDVATTYFKQQTRKKSFVGRNIIEYQNGKYVAVNPISEERKEAIRECLNEKQKEEFNAFLMKYWGEI